MTAPRTESKAHRVTTPAPPVDLSKLGAAVDHLSKASEELRSTFVQLAAQNAEMREKLELAYSHDPAAVDYVEHHSANTSAQTQVDDLAAKLEASAQAMSQTAHDNRPAPVPAGSKTQDVKAA